VQVVAVSLVLAAGLTAFVDESDEAPPRFEARELVPPNLLRGQDYALRAEVPTEGYFHEFVVESDYGTFPALGRSMLYVRLREVEALSALEDVSKTAVFAKAAGTSVLNLGKSVGRAVTDPEGTVKGIGSGLKRFGVNLGRKTKRAAGSVAGSIKGDEEGEAKPGQEKSAGEKIGEGSASVAKSVLGVTGASRRWAQKLGVDPYSSNLVLRRALEDVGKADAAGSIATRIVLPVPMLVGTTATVSNLVWGKDPEELRKVNEQRLAELGVDKDVASELLRSKAFTLTQQTRFVAGLHAVRAKGLSDYVDAAREAEDESDAEFFTESAEMLAMLHARLPVSAVLTDSTTLVARVAGRRAVALLPLDWVRLTGTSRKAFRELAERARKELSAGSLEIDLTGQMSPRALKEATGLGWRVKQKVPGPVTPPGREGAAGKRERG
jgi:hypothetical protein